MSALAPSVKTALLDRCDVLLQSITRRADHRSWPLGHSEADNYQPQLKSVKQLHHLLEDADREEEARFSLLYAFALLPEGIERQHVRSMQSYLQHHSTNNNQGE